MAPGAFDSGQEAALERCEDIRELGARTNPVYVARHSAAGGRPRLVILERFTGAAKAGDEKAAAFVREAKRIAALLNPNVTRMREVIKHGEDVLILSDYLDGERLVELWTLDEHHVPLEISLRILFDVLAGVGVLHELKDSKQQPLKLVHGELSPINVLVGLDGTSRLMFSAARRAPGATTSRESAPYLAPPEETIDLRADVFSAGVLLWEALAGRALFPASDGPVTAERARATTPPSVPEKAPWARPLVDIAAKALAPAASDRFASTAAMLTEMRKAVGVKIAASTSLASYMKATYGERIQARRVALEGVAAPQAASGMRTAAATPVAAVPKPEGSGPKLAGEIPRAEPSAPKLAVPPPSPAAPAPPPPALKAPAVPSSQRDLSRIPAIIPTLVPRERVAAPPPKPPSPIEELDEAEVLSSDSIPPPSARAERTSDMPTAIVEVPIQPRPSDIPTKLHSAEQLGLPEVEPRADGEAKAASPSPEASVAAHAAEAPPESPSTVVVTASEPPDDEGAALREQLRRRRKVIFGGVGALGLVMLVLTAWRLTHMTAPPPDLSAAGAPTDHGSVSVKVIKTAGPAAQPAPPPVHAEAPTSVTDSTASVSTPPPAPARPRPAPPAAVAAPAPAPNRTAAPPPPAKPKPTPARSKPKTFDPSSL